MKKNSIEIANTCASRADSMYIDDANRTSSLKTEETAESNNFVMTPDEVARYAKFSVKKIYRLCKANEIPFRKIGGQYRFLKVDIERWLKGEDYE